MIKRLTIFLLTVFLPFSVGAQSLKGFNTDTPIEITANALEVLQQEEKAMFKGEVVATQGKLQLTSDVMIVHYRSADKKGDAQAVSKIEVDGNVFLSTPDESARSHHGTYNVDGNMITLKGDVVLTRGENVVKGAVLEYDLTTGRSQIVGDKGGVAASTSEDGGSTGRVRGLFVPEKKE